MRYFIELSYDGNKYHGWQNQPKNISVQETIESAMSMFLKETISIVGAGRTDAGVHAQKMFAHFDTNVVFDKTNLIFRLNSFLPDDIAIHQIFKVKNDVHARFNALSRTYLYRISLKKNVFTFNKTLYIKQNLDVKKMQEAADILFKYKDFQCFSKSRTDVKTYNCNITVANWFLKDDELHFVIKADRFLRNMVRAIVGTIINIGLGKMSIDDFHAIIKSKDRRKAGASASEKALYLMEVEYPNDINDHE